MLTAFEIVYQALNGEPKPKKKAWSEFKLEWEKHKEPNLGVCCFCGRRKEVCNVGNFTLIFGLVNFTDFPRRVYEEPKVCVECLAVLKEHDLMNLSLLYFITLDDKFERDSENRLVIDNRILFKPSNDDKRKLKDGRRDFLKCLLNPPQDKPFICGWKREKSHEVPFSPVNSPGAKVIQVCYKSSIVYFDLERHKKLIDDADAYWRGGEMSGILEAYKYTPVGKMILDLTRPGNSKKAK